MMKRQYLNSMMAVVVCWSGAVLAAAPAQAPTADAPVVSPPEPVQLRGMPRPADLPLAPGPFKWNWDSIAQQFVCPEWFFDAKFGIWAHWSADSADEAGDWYHQRLYVEGSAPSRGPACWDE